MAILLTGTGSLPVRLGRLFYGILSANLYLGATDISAGGLKAVGITTTDILAQYASALQQVPDGITTYRDSTRSALSGWKSYLRQLAENTIVEMCHADVTLTEKTLEAALKELITQMIGAGTLYTADNDVDAPTVSATVTAFAGNTGNGKVLCSVIRPDGRPNELVLAETIEVIVSSDSGAGGTARSEPATVKGEVAVTDRLAFDWPAGSGASTTVTAMDPALDASGNMLYNGDFDAFTVTNKPDFFGDPLVGVYGTDIFQEATVIYRSGGKALKFTGTAGVPLSSIAQSFAQTVAVGSSGTSATLKPNTVYAVHCFIRKSAGLAAGNIEIRMLDSANAVVNDDAGTANTLTIAHGAITTSFASFGGFFRTPKTVTPATANKINIRVSTALTDTESVYIDDLVMCEATPAYTGGSYLAMFAGSTNFLKNDKFSLAIANNRAGVLQEMFDRCFDMRAKGLQLPSDTGGTETILDSVVA